MNICGTNALLSQQQSIEGAFFHTRAKNIFSLLPKTPCQNAQKSALGRGIFSLFQKNGAI